MFLGSDKESVKEILTITGCSSDGNYVNINFSTAATVEWIFEEGKNLGISAKEMVNQVFHGLLLIDLDEKISDKQPIHLSRLLKDPTTQFFFSKKAIDRIRKKHGLQTA